jgi:hypothetical protein
LKYLEAVNDYSQAFEQGVVYVDKIEALKMKIDRLEVFKPTSSNLEHFQTNDVTREKALVAKRDIRVLSAFKEVIDESTTILPRLLSILINIFPLFLLLLLFTTSIFFWYELKKKQRFKEEQEQEKEKIEADAQVSCSPLIQSTICHCILIIDLQIFYIGCRTDSRTMEGI